MKAVEAEMAKTIARTMSARYPEKFHQNPPTQEQCDFEDGIHLGLLAAGVQEPERIINTALLYVISQRALGGGKAMKKPLRY